MNTRITVCLALLLFTAGSSAACQSDLRRAVQSYSAKYYDLAAKHDGAGVARLIMDSTTADSVFVTRSPVTGKEEKETRAEVASDVKTAMGRINLSNVSSEIVSIRPAGSSFIVTMRTSGTATVPMRSSPDGRSYRGSCVQTTANTWVRVAGAWRIGSHRLLSATMGRLEGRL